MKRTIESVNRVLADWNPIGVSESIAEEEYKGYIPLILQSIENREQLMDCLENILTNKLGLDYDSTNQEQLEDLQQVCDKLTQVYQKTKAFE